jgi:NodT family efflux transporter outer membrane factor (OMF) lipoprotein
MKTPLLLGALALCLAGCSFIPTYERPAAPVAPAFPEPSASTGPAAAELPWADFLADARIRALVEIALKNNRDLRIAVLNVEQTRAALGVQRAELLPSVGIGANAARTGDSSAYALGLTLSSFELDLFGRVRSLSEAALARYLASDEGRRAAQVALIATVASTDLAIRADEEQLQLTQRTLVSREESLRLVRIRFDAGFVAEQDLRGAESLVAGARATLAVLQRQRSQNSNALALLIGQPLPADLPPPATLAALSLADLPAGLPSEVLLQRPDIRQAEQQLIAANANIGAARAAFFPRITLTGSAGFASNDLSSLFDNTGWTFTGQLLQPLFDAGRNQANLDAARAAREIAVAQYEKAIQVAFREVADALAGRATLGQQLAALQQQAEAETRRLELADVLLRGGAASLIDRQEVERSALVSQLGVVQAQFAQVQNAVLLYRVLGGGAGPAMSVAQ